MTAFEKSQRPRQATLQSLCLYCRLVHSGARKAEGVLDHRNRDGMSKSSPELATGAHNPAPALAVPFVFASAAHENNCHARFAGLGRLGHKEHCLVFATVLARHIAATLQRGVLHDVVGDVAELGPVATATATGEPTHQAIRHNAKRRIVADACMMHATATRTQTS